MPDMRSHWVVAGIAVAVCRLAAGEPVNLAPQAKVSASSEYSPQYAARFAVDGVIPEMLSKDDIGRAWVVDGARYGGKARFTLEWDRPVEVAEIIYYGRLAWVIEECFRDYEVRLDEAPEPVARGRFECNAGPQRIPLKAAAVRKITLDFLPWGGGNPGAEEIQVWSASPPDALLPKLKHLPRNVALSAAATASSEHSPAYAAAKAVDGVIPEPFTANDAGSAWATNGPQCGGKADFTLTWPKPVTVAEVAYYGRTSFLIEECFRDWELLLDDRTAASGTLQMGSGPQVIHIPPQSASRLVLRFKNAYGGPNPGAAEIQVYDELTSEGFLPKFLKEGWDAPVESPELLAEAVGGRLGFDKLLLVQRRELNPSHVYTACIEGFQPGGGLYVLSPVAPDGKLTRLVDAGNGQILDADLGFDAREIVFSWRKSGGEGYHLFRVNVDGSGLTQLTFGPYHDYNACWLPDGGIAFVSTRATVFALCFVTPSGVLHRMDRAGGHVTRLSANYVNDFTPSVMPDGRILYSRWEYVDKPAIPIQSLWTICPDGTGVQVYYGNRVLSPASFLEARAVPGTESVMCTLTSHNGPIRGAVGVVDRRHGVNAQAGIANLTPQVAVGRVDQGDGNAIRGAYENPYPLDAEHFLVSGKGHIYVGDRAGRWARLLAREAGLGWYNPQPLRARPMPPVRGSTLLAGVHDGAELFVADVYQGLAPEVKRGEVKQLAVVQEVAKPLRTDVMGFGFQRPVISCGATYAVKQVWGYAPVEADGSAHFQVPAGVPLYLMALDAQGRAVQRMRSFVHLMPGERRGCIGCHEERTHTALPHDTLALRRPASKLEPPEWGAVAFDYPKVVQPVLDARCAGCHRGVEAPGGIDLSAGWTDWFNVSYDVLTRGWVSWIDTRNGQEANILQVRPKTWGSPASRLTKLLLNGHPDAAGKPRVELSDVERRRLLTWIDLNVPYYGTYDMAYPDAEGGRRILPEGFEARLSEVYARRCAGCHQQAPGQGFVRLGEPDDNDFLAAPLARAAGGRESCGKPIFATRDDPDYRALRGMLEPMAARLAARPRMDMPGAKPAAANCSCQ
ncbi:MAG: PD40 domain-containing protein [Armatimonadetes bacterium]|nr:PD40 domain-containing protein [Armatimonadota bacterium]